MRIKTQRSEGGKHRKISTSQTTTGRVALVAIATGAASTAGVGGAAAASLQAAPAENTEAVNFELTNDAQPIDEAPVAESAPQILAISEYKPVASLDTQLLKAVEATAERLAAEFKSPSAQLPDRIAQLSERLKAAEKQVADLKAARLLADAQSHLDQARVIGDVTFLGLQLPAGDRKSVV